MLASQLCVLDDKADSNSISKKNHSMVVLSGLSLSSSFCEDFDPWFAATMTVHAKWMYHTLTQGIRRMKTFTM